MPQAGDIGAALIEALDYKREALFGAGAKLDLYKANGNTLDPVRSLTEGWSVRREGRPESGGYEWAIDLWALKWEDIQQVSVAKIVAHERTITYKLRPADRRIVGGDRLRIPVQPIG